MILNDTTKAVIRDAILDEQSDLDRALSVLKGKERELEEAQLAVNLHMRRISELKASLSVPI